NFAFGTHKGFINPVVGVWIVAAFTVDDGAIFIGEPNAVVIIYFTMVLAGPYHTASGPFGLYRIGTLDPVGHINVVYMLFHNMVSAQPVKIIPVSHLVFHFRLTGFPGPDP